ncbi:MAG: methyltransferase domain-containing protein [Chlorobiaceae bacterium]|nr:methyltransferase domain-containing protein [Chlorobiaceae bacterium]NTW10045.1 methyltransferase domain-containing protein [Chlorobiaceae bacterium]
MGNFTDISNFYQHSADLQKSAGEQLFSLTAIGKSDDVLDLGCGPGHLTAAIRKLTDGKVAGVDPSHGMIAKAEAAYPDERISFLIGDAGHLGMTDEFDLIFCNSTLQWFHDLDKAIANCYLALRSGGRMAIQAPARNNYCPNFIHAAEALLNDESTRSTFLHFRSPWIFFDTAEEYAEKFERCGFVVLSSEIKNVMKLCPPEKALEMFDTGAAAAYLNQECYDKAFPGNYIENARRVVARDFNSQAGEDNLVRLTFSRIYLLAQKT